MNNYNLFEAKEYFNSITEETELPVKGYVAGQIIARNEDIVCFCTENPWFIASREGIDKFYVYEKQLIDEDYESGKNSEK